MVAGRLRGTHLIFIAMAITGVAGSEPEARACDRASEPRTDTRASRRGQGSEHHRTWPLVHVSHPLARRVPAVHRTGEGERICADRSGNADVRDGTGGIAGIGIVRTRCIYISVIVTRHARRVVVPHLRQKRHWKENREKGGADAANDDSVK